MRNQYPWIQKPVGYRVVPGYRKTGMRTNWEVWPETRPERLWRIDPDARDKSSTCLDWFPACPGLALSEMKC